MLTDAHLLSELDESPAGGRTADGAVAAPVPPRPSLSARLGATSPGRFVLGCMQWTVVFGLILTGYFGAEAIHSGFELATRADAPSTSQILATAAPQN